MTDPLSALIMDLPEGQDLALGDLLERLGTRAHGTAILLLSLPDAIPLPVPSVGAILGVPLMFISLHLAIYGDAGRLPARLRRVRLPAHGIALIRRYVAPLLARAERWSRPRWSAIGERPRLVGLVCLLLSALLLLPIPLVNTPPALCLAVLAWGVTHRDGAFVAAGLGASAALGVALVLLVGQLLEFVA